jgi:hypothetical protein
MWASKVFVMARLRLAGYERRRAASVMGLSEWEVNKSGNQFLAASPNGKYKK